VAGIELPILPRLSADHRRAMAGNGEPFLMNWHCYAIYGDHGKPVYYVAEQDDVTELETLRMKERLFLNPNDETALNFFAVLHEWQCSREAL
jgi:hypothetical protein